MKKEGKGQSKPDIEPPPAPDSNMSDDFDFPAPPPFDENKDDLPSMDVPVPPAPEAPMPDEPPAEEDAESAEIPVPRAPSARKQEPPETPQMHEEEPEPDTPPEAPPGGPEEDIPDTLFDDILKQGADEEASKQEEILKESEETPGSIFGLDEMPEQTEEQPIEEKTEEPEALAEAPAKPEQRPAVKAASSIKDIDTTKPLFINASAYMEILDRVDSLSSDIKNIEEKFSSLYDNKMQLDDKYEKWKKLIEYFHKKLRIIDETVYKGE